MVNVLKCSSICWFSVPIILGLLYWRNLRYKTNKTDAIFYLHQEHPKLEYSLGLLDNPLDEDNLLAKFQKDKIEKELKQTDVILPSAKKQMLDLSATLILSIFSIGLLSQIAFPTQELELKSEETVVDVKNIDIEKDSAYIDNFYMKIVPPAYTNKSSYQSTKIENEVSEGTVIQWRYDTHGPVESVLFNIDKEAATKKRSKQFFKSGIYYFSVLDTAGKKYNSPYYAVKVNEDKKPTVALSGIEEYQRLPWKKNYDVHFNIEISDDFGVEDAFISATVANGQGESVKFREKTFPLKNYGKSSFTFSTEEFEMEPGSELYFYVMAKDNCPYRIQATKSTTYFVILEDTVTYDYVEDAGMQVDLMPDFFRSQRQIIIDTEKLIAEKSAISDLEFKQRSNELGFDQKMLRLKYGQFLGEEAESGIAIENEIETDDHSGHDHDHDHEEGGHQEINVLEEYGHAHDHEAEAGELLSENGTRNEDPSRPDWVKEMSHNHDDGETNTYFEVSLRTKLKAALSVMWDSELYLRLYEPSKSLPYQYEALEYLEEIKNHARVYVHRIGFDPPAIKVAEKRLTGDQDKIASPSEEMEKDYETSLKEIKKAIDYFSAKQVGSAAEISLEDKEVLQSAGNELASLAIENPSLLGLLSRIRGLINGNEQLDERNRNLLLGGLLKAIPNSDEEIIHEDFRIHPVNKAILEAL
ncbi:hypothetical protein GCM10007940_21290 [Portibacter lacus]|uniref:DUF4175 domain-containing protein n=2 Tax=Portibacter lacus TaxID=1099794 RepID=A0AA37SQG8_9BACT|nr:hypothetical protein GCM10007940_21290 [Portibacter lacus]